MKKLHSKAAGRVVGMFLSVRPRQIIRTTKPNLISQERAVSVDAKPQLTQVDTSETPTNRGFSMFPSRHRQVAKDLAYLEDRKPWQIIDDAIEEYVVKHYGKEHKRK